MEGGGVHLLVFDAQRIELRFDDLLAILSSESLCQPPFEFGGHRLLLLALPLLSLEVHLLLVLALHLKESGTFAFVEVRLLSLGDAAILQSLQLPLGLAHQFRLSLEARLIVLDLDLLQLLLRENVARPAVFCSSITSKEEMLESIHQTVDGPNLNVLRVLGDLRGTVVASEDGVIRVQLHDCEQCPLHCREVALLHRDAAVETLLAAELENDLDELLEGGGLETDSVVDAARVRRPELPLEERAAVGTGDERAALGDDEAVPHQDLPHFGHGAHLVNHLD